KIKGKVSKYILKKVAERYLPKELIYRPKTGFGAPVREWIMHDFSSHLDKALSESEISRQGIFDPEAVRKLIRDNQDKKVDASYILLEILAIHSWLDRYAPQGSIL
ncbi:MAG TPA: asparagine synthase-related protein, partial [Saprospiraceae bacterium]|nr:asparagine synthase-related protein [Saprospiraceae bacterium]